MNKVIVHIIESEAGWGQKIDDVKAFDTRALAKEFVDSFNSKNTEELVPSWYMYAMIVED
jgi:hypothetical protein